MGQMMQAATVETPLPDAMRREHTAQNMDYVFNDIAEEQEKATKNQFKVFQFCHGVKNGTFDFDMV